MNVSRDRNNWYDGIEKCPSDWYVHIFYDIPIKSFAQLACNKLNLRNSQTHDKRRRIEMKTGNSICLQTNFTNFHVSSKNLQYTCIYVYNIYNYTNNIIWYNDKIHTTYTFYIYILQRDRTQKYIIKKYATRIRPRMKHVTRNSFSRHFHDARYWHNRGDNRNAKMHYIIRARTRTCRERCLW